MRYSVIASWVTLALLTGCGGGDGDPFVVGSSKVVNRMSPVESGFQTFKSRDHSVSALSQGDRQTREIRSSKYVYENPELGASNAITFESVDVETGESETAPSPTVVSVVDLNTQYAAINMKNVTITANGQKQRGSYTLIQNKQSGDLYPLIEDGNAIYKTVVAEHEAWMTSARFSNVADESRIYMRHGDGKSLHVAELVNGQFEISPIFNDYFRNNWVLPSGDVITLPWDVSELTWKEKATGKTFTHAFDNSANTLPFIYEDVLYYANLTSGAVYQLTTNGENIGVGTTEWSANGYQTDANAMSVRRGDYEMTSDCSVYKFDSENKRISRVHHADLQGGVASAAGQNSLYCVRKTGTDDNGLPSIARFDITTQRVDNIEATSGSVLNAGERFVVVSDEEVMFYQYPNGSFSEYYVNVETGLTSEKVTSAMSVIKMQTVQLTN
ncbi:hypothetical protein [Enterovibrio norvegicus]|uniref:Lipoprotein n=1 Tax=Enterovibrio norvegicus TaxID=188144 RepID=A0A2N7L7Z0_9GAMM|nr:hypothetical protein [Enterovibrio norvegicus]PMN90217.1 hypothetical protein BCT23_20650 [Enterovibrio norvegicus]